MRPLLLLALLFSCTTASGQGLTLEALLDDTGSPPPATSEPSALIPKVVNLDQVYQSINIEWDTLAPETLPFAAIAQVEHVRPWDGHNAKLFLSLKDGRRLLMASGDTVAKDVELIKAWLAHMIVELPPSEGHSGSLSATPSPQLTITAAGTLLTPGRLLAPTPSSSASTGPAVCDDCIAKGDIDRVVRQRIDQIRSCYQEARRHYPKLAGDVTMRFEISTSGVLGSASIKKSTLNNQGAEACIREQFLKIVFPRPPGNKSLQMTYTLVFSPAD